MLSNIAAILVQFALVAWRQKNNFRSKENYGESNDIKNSLAKHQWVLDNPVPVTDITEAEIVAEMSERQVTYDTYKGIVNPTPAQVVEFETFKQLFLDPEGNLVKPKYSGNAGFRRSTIFFAAMVQRAVDRAKPENVEHTISGLVPVRVTTYATPVDRIIDQQRENELMAFGAVKMADLDKLKVTKALYSEGCREIKVRELYSSSVGQKAYGICQADQNWPTLNIYNRFFLPVEAPGFIPWGPVRGEVLIRQNARFEADRKRSEGLPLKADERGLEPIGVQEVTDYYLDRAKLATDGNATKSMAKKDMESGAKNHKLLAVRKVFDSVIGNTQVNLKSMLDHSLAMNGITELVTKDEGKTYGDIADRVVVSLVQNVPLYDLFTKVVEAGKLDEARTALTAILASTVAAVPTPVTVPAPETPVVTPSPEAASGSSTETPAPAPAEASAEPVTAGKHGKHGRK